MYTDWEHDVLVMSIWSLSLEEFIPNKKTKFKDTEIVTNMQITINFP